MSEIDLIPAEYAGMQRARRRLRVVAGFLVSLACAVLASRLALGMLVDAEKRRVAELQQVRTLWQSNKAKTERYTQQIAVTERQLLALDEMRGRDDLRLLVEALERAYVEKLWLDELKYYRPVAEKPAAPGAIPAPAQRAMLAGHALSHGMLAEFMKRLQGQPGIAEVTLLDTSARTYPGTRVVDFKLTLVVAAKPKGRP